MTAADVIEQIKALDSLERAKVLTLLLEIQAGEDGAAMDDETFDRAADRVMDRHSQLLRKLAQ